MQSMAQIERRVADMKRQLDSIITDQNSSLESHNVTNEYIQKRVLTLGVRIGRVTAQVSSAVSADELGSGYVKLSDRLDVYSEDDEEPKVFNISEKIYTVGTLVAVVRIGDDFFVCSDPGIFIGQTYTLDITDVLRATSTGEAVRLEITDSLGDAATTLVLTFASADAAPAGTIHVDTVAAGLLSVTITNNDTAIVTLEGTVDNLNLLFAGPGESVTLLSRFASTDELLYLASLVATATASDSRTSTETAIVVAAEMLSFLDEDDMVSDDPLAVPSQQSVKAYVDAQLIQANTDLYVATTGNDTTGDGSSGLPWLTVAKAFTYLNGYRIEGTATVTIHVGDGDFAIGTALAMNHPDGKNIAITGTNTYAKTMSSVQSSSGSAGSRSVIINVNSVTNIAANDYIILKAPTGGTRPYTMAGCWKVTNVDAVNTRITVTCTSMCATAPSGSIASAFTVIKSRIVATACNGINITTALGSIDNIVLVGDNSTAAAVGINMSVGSVATVGELAGVNVFGIGLSITQANVTFNGAISGSRGNGIVGTNNCAINSTAVSVSSGNGTAAGTGHGMVISNGSAASPVTSIFSGNNSNGLQAANAAAFALAGTISDSNISHGIALSTGSGATMTSSATFTNNASMGIVVQHNASAQLTSAVSSNNAFYGVFIGGACYVVVTSLTATGNGTATYNMLTDKLQQDGSIIVITTPTGPVMSAEFDLISTADETANNAQNQDHTQLQFAVTAGECWEVTLMFGASANDATGDIAMNLVTTGTWATTTSYGYGTHWSSAAALTARATAVVTSATNAFGANPGLVVNNGDGVVRPCEFHLFFLAATSGTVKLQFSVNTLTAARTATIHKGARLIARRIRTP